jgi:alpha-tubulin suppressor-like RCC1 family protein
VTGLPSQSETPICHQPWLPRKDVKPGPNSTATRATKRKHVNDDNEHPTATRGSKKARFEPRPSLDPARNRTDQAPTEVRTVLVFGNGHGGELSLGPSMQEATRPRLNQLLDAFRVVQLACGGMHTIALTKDNRIDCNLGCQRQLRPRKKYGLGRWDARRRWRLGRRWRTESSRGDFNRDRGTKFPVGNEICTICGRG